MENLARKILHPLCSFLQYYTREITTALVWVYHFDCHFRFRYRHSWAEEYRPAASNRYSRFRRVPSAPKRFVEPLLGALGTIEAAKWYE